MGSSPAATSAANGWRRLDSSGAKRRVSSTGPVAVVSGPTDGITPPSTATTVTRPASAGTPAQARANGPPPERPIMPSRSAPSASATWAMSAAQSATA